ncbi:hypothetical protein RFI_24636 [Reticulomyxa filosa]|uniref:Endonuclease/exonuclease/phosphatase domain-containing protein n=1 Tax=Reticulomyxa filosa TaxID=46433 RepID=X6MFQ5_RETFI|nr:hypothetical protein RFI_24636 [Reticulomyxa filosa]|eukprot:ETO12739.1 hypothetical protein RFI_24636 [Reticulomyxa filosa]
MSGSHTNEKLSSVQFCIATFNLLCPYWNWKSDEISSKEKWLGRQEKILEMLQQLVDDEKSATQSNVSKTEDKSKEVATEEMKQQKGQGQNPEAKKKLCDVICLQEFWCENEEFVELYKQTLGPLGYELHYMKRTETSKPDGLATFVNTNDWKVISVHEVTFKGSNRVALIHIIQHKQSEVNVLICNNHWNCGIYQSDEMKRRDLLVSLLEVLEEDASVHDKANGNNNGNDKSKANGSKQSTLLLSAYDIDIKIVCGDFNCEFYDYCPQQLVQRGYLSALHEGNNFKLDCAQSDQSHNPNSNKHDKFFVSHLNHHKIATGCDLLLFKHAKQSPSLHFNPIASYLYPRQLDWKEWPKKEMFGVSDHRPVVAVFEITTAKKKKQTD